MATLTFQEESQYWLRMASLIPDSVFLQNEQGEVGTKKSKGGKKERRRKRKKNEKASKRKKLKVEKKAESKEAGEDEVVNEKTKGKAKKNSFSFGAIDTDLGQEFAIAKKERKKHAKQQLKDLKKKQNKIKSMPKKEQEEVVRKQKVANAFKRIAGEKVVDDVSKLKKKIKKREKRKQKSQKEWKKRTKKVEELKKAKQLKRTTNLGDRAKMKIQKKLGPRVSDEVQKA